MKTTTGSQKIAKYILTIVGVVFALGTFIPAVSLGQQFSDAEFPYDINGQEYDANTEVTTTDFATGIIRADTQNRTSILQRLTDFFRLSNTVYNPTLGDPNNTSVATNYIKWILNIMLGLVSFLSLVMIIFAFYLIFFSKGEDGVAKAKKILIGVGIALAVMGLSWFIASFFFDLYNTVTV
ncbi:MAG: pilin [Candidatus Absconditabacterales bacterium]